MQRAGELEKLAVLYGYQCRHQEEFAVRPRTLQFHNSLLQLITLQAFLICLSILHSCPRLCKSLPALLALCWSHASQCI